MRGGGFSDAGSFREGVADSAAGENRFAGGIRKADEADLDGVVIIARAELYRKRVVEAQGGELVAVERVIANCVHGKTDFPVAGIGHKQQAVMLQIGLCRAVVFEDEPCRIRSLITLEKLTRKLAIVVETEPVEWRITSMTWRVT